MARVLLYNIQNEEKLTKLRLLALRLGLEPVAVDPADFGHPLGYLLHINGFAPAAQTERFEEEMLVMERLSSPLLEAMRREGAGVALKAVVTEHNIGWSSAALCRELRREHAAMQAHAAARPRHPKRR